MTDNNNNNNNDNISTLSSRSSRSEHIAYLVNEVLGLDRNTASMLYRAERLQEKGQLKLALKYFQQVLEKHPDCHEAQENARMTSELIQEEEESRKKLETIVESKESGKQQHVVVTEMEVHWTASEYVPLGYFPEPDTAAFWAAKVELNKTGHGNSLLKLIENLETEDLCNADTGWKWIIGGVARFEVTLLHDDMGEGPLDLKELADMVADVSLNDGLQVFEGGPSGNVQPNAPTTQTTDDAVTVLDAECNSTSSWSSRFADAESDVMAEILVRRAGSKPR